MVLIAVPASRLSPPSVAERRVMFMKMLPSVNMKVIFAPGAGLALGFSIEVYARQRLGILGAISYATGFTSAANSMFARPTERLTPVVPSTDQGCSATVLPEPPIRKFSPTPTPKPTLPLAPT